MKKKCPVCGTEFEGRVDKKFCCDQCRNTYNNHLNQKTTLFTYDVNKILKNNRKVLFEMYEKIDKPETERHSVSKEKMLKAGFKFDYLTNIYKTKSDKMYYYCYDYGYYYDNEYVVIVPKKEYVD